MHHGLDVLVLDQKSFPRDTWFTRQFDRWFLQAGQGVLRAS